MAEPSTYRDHDTCTNHRRYKLSCQQYEGLLERADGICEMCRRPLARGPRGRLAIDHLGPSWAVRGLLCNGCNAGLGDENRSYRNAEEYLANAWWERQCAVLGLPLTIRPEPEVGSAIRNQLGVVWVHQSKGLWEAGTQCGNHWHPRGWADLFEGYGPHNLMPYDLPAAYADDSMSPGLRYAIEHGRDWGPIRVATGLSEAPVVETRAAGRSESRSSRGAIPWLVNPETTARILRFYLTKDERLRTAELLLLDDSDTGQPIAAISPTTEPSAL